jgi:hypothetical protein
MNQIWRPDLQHPDRLHAFARPGIALCGAELGGPTPEPVHCAVCSLSAHGHRDVPHDIRRRIEKECAENDELTPEYLLTLSSAKVAAAADALDGLGNLLLDGYTELESALRVLRRAPGESPRARLIRAHLLEALVALNVAVSDYSRADDTLRFS